MIVSAEEKRFVPRGAGGLITADGKRLSSIERVFVRGIALRGREIGRVYAGDTLVYETPRSYFYLNLVN